MQERREVLELWKDAKNISDIIIQNEYYRNLPQAERDTYKEGLSEMTGLYKSFREGYKEINDLREALGRFSDLNSQMSKYPEMRFGVLKGKFNQLDVEEQEIMGNASLEEEDKCEELKMLVPKAQELYKEANELYACYNKSPTIFEQVWNKFEEWTNNESFKRFHSRKKELEWIRDLAVERRDHYKGETNVYGYDRIQFYSYEDGGKQLIQNFNALKQSLQKLNDGHLPPEDNRKKLLIQAESLKDEINRFVNRRWTSNAIDDQKNKFRDCERVINQYIGLLRKNEK